MGTDIKPVLVLNDQGGAVMYVTHDVTGTLRAEMGGHPPLVFDARGNGGVQYPQRSQEIIKTESRTIRR